MSMSIAEIQMLRILAMIPWLASRPGVSKIEVCERFVLTPDQLERDLDLILMVGTPPYTPGNYVNVIYDGEMVDLFLAPVFDRQFKLSQGEGVAILAAATAILAVKGVEADGPLARAAAKLRSALDAVGVDVVVELSEPLALDAVRRAAGVGRTLSIEYWSSGRAQRTTREIDPSPPFFALGNWYTDSFCHLRNERRLFRVDRIRALHESGGRFAPSDLDVPNQLYSPDVTATEVILRTPVARSGVLYDLPFTEIETQGDWVTASMPVSERTWLERLILLLGPGTEVLTPPEWSDTGAIAARRVLESYS
ncbi:putative transcriptional regulator [Actinobacteria bacterium IMCC26256]|nr:putative transcriptional regulator [Actinobacteria bacterium IMCC26256]